MSFIRAELRFKNASLYNAITSMGLKMGEFAKLCGINVSSLSQYITFTKYPGAENMTKICDFLGESKYDLFLKYHKQYQMKCPSVINWDISEPQFKRISDEGVNYKLLSTDFKKDLSSALSTLTEKESEVVKMFYLEEKSTYEISLKLNMSTVRVNQLRKIGLNKIRRNKKSLKDYIK